MAPVSTAPFPAKDHRCLTWFKMMSYIPLLECAGLNCKAVRQDMGARGAAHSVPLIGRIVQKDHEACIWRGRSFCIGDSVRIVLRGSADYLF